MKKSGLSKDTLKSIYLIASQYNKQFLERDEFYVALKLIQNNMPNNSQESYSICLYLLFQILI